jgi:hypothetical protein
MTSSYDDLHNFHKSEKRHSNAVAHILSLKNLKLFGKNKRTEFSLSEQHRLSVQHHNEQVRKNRILFTHLIGVICVLGKLGLAFRGRDKSETSVNRGNYVEMLKLLGNYDADLKFLVGNKGVFRCLSPKIQNIITSVSECMVREIKREVSETAFVSLIVDEATSVLRYVSKNGDVEERFLHFTDLSCDWTAMLCFSMQSKFCVISIVHQNQWHRHKMVLPLWRVNMWACKLN